MIDRYLIGIDITNESVERAATVNASNLLSIDSWEPKKNYQVPRFHLPGRTMSVPLTIKDCQLCFPEFISFYQGALVNTRAINYLRSTAIDNTIHFLDSEFTTPLRQHDIPLYKKYMVHYQVNLPQPMSTSGVKILVVDIQTYQAAFIPMEDIILIDLWTPKRNYKVPRFYTRDRIYTVPLTLEMCHSALPEMFPADGSNLINLDHVDHLEKTFYQTTIVFKRSNHVAYASNAKARQLGKIFPVLKV